MSRGSFAAVSAALEVIRTQATAVGQAMRGMRLDAEAALAAVEKAKKDGKAVERTTGVKRKAAPGKPGAAVTRPPEEDNAELYRLLVSKNGRS